MQKNPYLGTNKSLRFFAGISKIVMLLFILTSTMQKAYYNSPLAIIVDFRCAKITPIRLKSEYIGAY
jgi:hypothetical protein